jgi:hypothetical protein
MQFLGAGIPMVLRLLFAIMVVAAVVAVAWLAWTAWGVFLRWFTAWKFLAAKFPLTNFPAAAQLPTIARYTRQGGYYYRGGSSAPLNHSFCIEISPQGVRITPRFARRLPIFVPWSAIASVEEVHIVPQVQIKLEYDGGRHINFWMPRQALDLIEQQVPAERIRKTTIGRLIADRARASEVNQ